MRADRPTYIHAYIQTHKQKYIQTYRQTDCPLYATDNKSDIDLTWPAHGWGQDESDIPSWPSSEIEETMRIPVCIVL